jgi:hypothetical protein
MKNCKEIYLIGPSKSKIDYDVKQLDGKVTLSFSGDLMWFNNNNIHPTYWTFLDPNSTSYIFNRFQTGKYNKEWFAKLKEKSYIIFNDFQGTDSFYDQGFTTSKGRVWNREQFGKEMLPNLCEQFKDIIKVPTVVLQDSYGSFYKEDTKDKTPIVRHEAGMNSDKLSCFILPLVLSYFDKLESIKCIGFGDFTTPRLYNGLSLGYDGYKLSYQRMKNKLIDLLKHKRVRVEFDNKNSFFKELEF